MGRFVLKRILQMIPVLLMVAVLIFTILYFVPGDPAQIMLGSTATKYELEQMREQLGLTRPFLVQLGDFLYQTFIKFDLGKSYLTGAPVGTEIAARLPRTLILGVASMVLAFGIGIPLGITAAIHQNGWGDRISMIIALLGVSIPTFWLALMFVLLFALKLRWFPSSGIGGFKYYVLPTVSLCFGGLATQARQSRSSMLEVIRADYVVTARAKGLSEREVIMRHALPNALNPIITLAGNNLAVIFGGSIVIENVFSFPGIGQYMITAINQRDYPIVRGCVVMLAIVFAVIMLLVDIAYAFNDPRIKARYENSGRKTKVKKA
ncbi:MAG: ABC transporter permease [Solobacterium sp.]|nr:ABC transporter permease [Solobacterium sp.]